MYSFSPKKSHLKLKWHVLSLRPVNHFLREIFRSQSIYYTYHASQKKNDNFPVIYTLNYKEEDIYKIHKIISHYFTTVWRSYKIWKTKGFCSRLWRIIGSWLSVRGLWLTELLTILWTVSKGITLSSILLPWWWHSPQITGRWEALLKISTTTVH